MGKEERKKLQECPVSGVTHEKLIHVVHVTTLVALPARDVLQTEMSLNLWVRLLTAVRVFLLLKANLKSTSSIGRDPPGRGNRFSHPECARPARYPPCLSGVRDAVGGLWTGGGDMDRDATTQMPCDSVHYLASLSCFLLSKAVLPCSGCWEG